MRDGREGDELETLDGETRKLDPDMVVICDDDGPTSLAGVMGGARSEVHDGTTRVLLESATWDGPNIQRTSTRLGAAQRGVRALREGARARAGDRRAGGRDAADRRAVRRAARASARSTSTRRPGGIASHAVIRLRDARVSGLLGAPIARERSAEILRRARLRRRRRATTGST